MDQVLLSVSHFTEEKGAMVIIFRERKSPVQDPEQGLVKARACALNVDAEETYKPKLRS